MNFLHFLKIIFKNTKIKMIIFKKEYIEATLENKLKKMEKNCLSFPLIRTVFCQKFFDFFQKRVYIGHY